MPNTYRTPYDGHSSGPADHSRRRFATTTVLITGALVGSSALTAWLDRPQTNYGVPFTHNGQQYYVAGDSKRAVYPNYEACMQDVPVSRQSECEPVDNYNGSSSGYSGRWYGPVYNPRDSYQPSGQYPSETASSSNMGKQLPDGANMHGFGSNGKAFTGSKGG